MENTETIVTNTERDAAVVTAPKANLSLLSNEPWLQENVNTFEMPKQEPKTNVNLQEQEKKDEGLATDLNIEKQPNEVEKAAVEEKVADEPLTIEETPLTIDTEVSETPEDSWFFIAKQEGLEIKEDSFASVKEALTAPLLEQLEQVKTAKVEDYLVDIDPQIRMQIELNKAGLSYEDIKAPLENIAKYRAMNPVELVREDLTLTYLNTKRLTDVSQLTDEDKAFIDTEIESKIESGKIDHEYKRIRLLLDGEENNIKDQQQAIIDKFKINSARISEEKRNNEVESVKKALSETQRFMGSTIDKDSLENLGKEYANGTYDKLLKDPNFIKNAILYHKLGEKAHEVAIAKSRAEGELKTAKEFLHNTPPLDKVGAGKAITTETKTGLQALKDEPSLKG